MKSPSPSRASPSSRLLPHHLAVARDSAAKWPTRFSTVSLFFLLFLSEFKADPETVTAVNMFWQDLAINPYISLLKSYSILAILPTIAFCLLSLVTLKRLFIRVLPLPLLIATVSFLAAFRTLAGDEEGAYKAFVSFCIISALLGYLIVLVASIGSEAFRRVISNAIILSSSFLIVSNAFNYLTGFGFVPSNARLFGTSAHPNFLGVQLALANLAMLAAIFFFHSALLRIFFATNLASGIPLLVLTGSRTALLMLLTGFIVFLLTRRRFAFDRVLVVGLFLGAVAAAYILFGPDNLNHTSFDRGFGTGDTRSAAIEDLLDQISLNPLLGTGYFAGASENSYLRGWAAYGLGYEIFFLFSVIRILYVGASLARSGRFGDLSLFVSLSYSLAIGAFFEGFLVDNFSNPLILWLMISAAFSAAYPAGPILNRSILKGNALSPSVDPDGFP